MKLKNGQVLTNREISRFFSVSARRGIRYSGSLKTGIKHVVLITSLHKKPEEHVQNPYLDRVEGPCLYYTGEGRIGDQKMLRGNLALKRQMEEKYPVYVFEKKGPGRYGFLGKYNVESFGKDSQPDAHGNWRKVFLFKLVKRLEMQG